MEIEIKMRINGKDRCVRLHVMYVCREREREREVRMCSQVTDCSAPYVLFRSGKVGTHNDGMANTYGTLGRRTYRSGQMYD